MRTIASKSKATDETMSQAFSDLKALMEKAKEMVCFIVLASCSLLHGNTSYDLRHIVTYQRWNSLNGFEQRK
jgi:hypothetical protein